MRIVHLVPGSGGGFYCQNCLRDVAVVAEQRRLGHDAIIAPLYLPLLDAERAEGVTGRVFYGAVSLYLRQRSALVRRLPVALTRLLDAAPVLAFAARRAGSTRAAGLEAMTLSMLRGEEGNQAAELEELVGWMRNEARPDVIHISNGLLLGTARRLKREVGCLVVCSLQDEDQWVEPMGPTWAGRVWSLMAERATDVDLFLPVSHYYGERMAARLHLPPEKLHTVHLGVDPEPYRESALDFDPPTIGFLSRLCKSLGLGHLVEAFIELAREPGMERLRLRLAGGRTADDEPFLRDLGLRLDGEGLSDRVDMVEGLQLEDRVRFLASLSILSVPIPAGEAFGAFQLEAMAAGVPVVQPDVGAFPEVIAATGGGLTYPSSNPNGLTDALRSLLLDHERARRLGRHGRHRVCEAFTIERMAREVVAAYGTCRTAGSDPVV